MNTKTLQEVKFMLKSKRKDITFQTKTIWVKTPKDVPDNFDSSLFLNIKTKYKTNIKPTLSLSIPYTLALSSVFPISPLMSFDVSYLLAQKLSNLF